MGRGSLVYFHPTTEVWARDLGQPKVRVVLAWEAVHCRTSSGAPNPNSAQEPRAGGCRLVRKAHCRHLQAGNPQASCDLGIQGQPLRYLVPPKVMIIFLPNSPCQGGASLQLALPSHRAWHQAKPNLCVSEQTAADGARRSAVTSHSPPQNIISVCLKVHH